MTMTVRTVAQRLRPLAIALLAALTFAVVLPGARFVFDDHVLIEHNMALVQAVADGIVVLHHGQLLTEGSPAAVLRDPAVIDAYLGQVSAHAHR